MKAELIVLGKRLDMASRAHRQLLVISIYIGLALIMTAFWFVDRWHETGFYMVFIVFLVNRILLGGYQFGGLIKPFNNKGPRSSPQPPPFLVLGLRLYKPEPNELDYRNDERELQQRDHAHYYAYQGFSIFPGLLWLLAGFRVNGSILMSRLHLLGQNVDMLIYALALTSVVVCLTLPQAILLWSEPDMSQADLEEFLPGT